MTYDEKVSVILSESDSNLHRLTIRRNSQVLNEELSRFLNAANIRNGYERAIERAKYCSSDIDLYINHEDNIELPIARYCNSRSCLVCLRIKAAKHINGYAHFRKENTGNIYFQTLTFRNVGASSLDAALDFIFDTLRKFNKSYQKHISRGKHPAVQGLRKIEVTYKDFSKEKSISENDYDHNGELIEFHPHVHITHNSREYADALSEYWQNAVNRHFGHGHFSYLGQDTQLIHAETQEQEEKILLEISKYFTKLFKLSDANPEINPYAFSHILQCLSRRRILQPFGGLRMNANQYEKIFDSAKFKKCFNRLHWTRWNYELQHVDESRPDGVLYKTVASSPIAAVSPIYKKLHYSVKSLSQQFSTKRQPSTPMIERIRLINENRELKRHQRTIDNHDRQLRRIEREQNGSHTQSE